MFRQRKSQTSIAILFALTAASTPTAVSFVIHPPALAQSPSFPVPQSVPSGTDVRINGTTSMEKINQALAEQFKAKYPGTDVKIAYDGTDASLKALPDGKIDLAAVGRSLTEAEKARGLVSTPITRNKIAVIISKNNPYRNSLTSEQFAKIFRGEITNWSQVGGSSQAIRLVDRPENSDLRQALRNYPVFQKAPFQTGANAVRLSQDSTNAVVKELGANGIGYAIADQVINDPNVQIISLHKVLPTDPRYPFSQPLAYAYSRLNPSPAAQAFLGYATAPENQRVVEQARAANAIATPETTLLPPTPATTTAPKNEFPWWILLLIPLLGGLLWWLLSRRRPTTPSVAPAPVPATLNPESRLILTPRTCRDVYAYWEVPNEVKADLQRQGGRYLKLRLYDVTDINDMDRQPPHSMKEFDCDERSQDRHIPITVDNRDYIGELGYVSSSDRWLRIARSAHVRVPACELDGAVPAAVTGVAAHSLASDRPTTTKDESRVILVPRDKADVYAYWEVPEARKAELRQQGGRQLALRVYDHPEQEPTSFRQFNCDESTPDLHIPIAENNREHIAAELGYLTDDGRWLKLAHAAPTEVPSPKPAFGTVPEQVENISKVAGMGTAARSFLDRRQPSFNGDRTTSDQPEMKSDCRIILVPRNSQEAYAYWEISDEYKAAVRRQGGRRLMLRVHDVTNLDIDNQQPYSTQEYLCDEHDQDKHILIPMSDRDYIAEVGYYTDDHRWLSIIRSFHVHVPSHSRV
ncbi:MAG: extracellular solute-binding protein [Desmonostoc vinosum HA7617-LM4]|jgi:phosphate transport system substrate-binding protein|nr:extracellular solute-binding protein [Desmonostoc vinosum HA7617-LM4]